MGRMHGAIRTFRCDKCEDMSPLFVWDDDIAKACCQKCGGAVTLVVSRSSKQQGLDYDQPVLSDSMGVAESQVEEHRRLYPDVPITDDGRVILRNHQESKRIRKRLGFFDRAGYC